MESLLCGIFVQSFRLLEVNDTPDGIEVVWLHVLVLEIECVLPDVDANDGYVG